MNVILVTQVKYVKFMSPVQIIAQILSRVFVDPTENVNATKNFMEIPVKNEKECLNFQLSVLTIVMIKENVTIRLVYVYVTRGLAVLIVHIFRWKKLLMRIVLYYK